MSELFCDHVFCVFFYFIVSVVVPVSFKKTIYPTYTTVFVCYSVCLFFLYFHVHAR